MAKEFGAGWYAVSLANGLEPSTSTGIRLRGQEIVLWRDSDCVAHAWEDRCPHRGMRLSLGFVRGNHIACLYHGWQYDTGGQCRYIPAHPDLTPPASICTVLYPCREWLGMIWVHSEPSADVPTFAVPDMGIVTPVRSITADCAAERMCDMLTLGCAAARLPGADIVRLHVEGHDIFAAIQPITQTKAALHIVLAGAPANLVTAQIAVAQWAEDRRRELEAATKGSTEAAMSPAAMQSATRVEVVQ